VCAYLGFENRVCHESRPSRFAAIYAVADNGCQGLSSHCVLDCSTETRAVTSLRVVSYHRDDGYCEYVICAGVMDLEYSVSALLHF